MPRKDSKVRAKILTPRISSLQGKVFSPASIEREEIRLGPLKKVRSPVSKVARELAVSPTAQRPFNSQNRTSYLAMGTALHSTVAKVQKQEGTGSPSSNGVIKAKIKLERDKIRRGYGRNYNQFSGLTGNLDATQDSLQSYVSRESSLSGITSFTG